MAVGTRKSAWRLGFEVRFAHLRVQFENIFAMFRSVLRCIL